MARDYPRDGMPKGYLWDVVDFVPLIIDAPLTGRGGWRWGSDVAAGDFESGILAGYTSGDQLLVQDTTGAIVHVNDLSPYNTIAVIGSGPRAVQNPVQLKDDVIHCDVNGARVPQIWRAGAILDAYGGMNTPTVATVYNSMLVSSGAAGSEDVVRFSVPGQTLDVAASYDGNSFFHTSQRVTGLAALRSVVLVFHPGSVERIRGSIPPHGTASTDSDMFVEKLFDRVGCQDPRSIAYWNDNCVFADEHGVHLTDGATIRNMISQGGMLYYWRTLYATKLSLSACTFLDFYIITIRQTGGLPAITLVCDLNRRQWFRLGNIQALTLISSGGSRGMERIWGGMQGTQRLARLGPMFFPAPSSDPVADDNGQFVLPSFETPWYRLAEEGRKRVRFAYLSYDTRSSGSSEVVELDYMTTPQADAYTTAGLLPPGNEYDRFRIPVGKFCYGIAFHVHQIAGASVFRVFDIAVEASAAERSRV